jgi:hypothetical protein
VKPKTVQQKKRNKADKVRREIALLLDLDPDTYVNNEDHIPQDLLAEATLYFLQGGAKDFEKKNCLWCGSEFRVATFATCRSGPYGPVAYCSTPCRKRALSAIGIKWDPLKTPAERWQRIPMVVSPEVLSVLHSIFADTDSESEPSLSET